MAEEADEPTAWQTIGGFDAEGRLWVFGLFGLGGAALGAVIPYLARLATELPFVPFAGPLKLLASFDQAWLVWGRPVVGLAAGLAFAGWVVLGTPVLQLSPAEIRVQRRGQVERVIQRRKVDAVYRRGSKIVIETQHGRELFNDEIEGDKAVTRGAFVSQGYPWEGEPE